MRLHRTVLVAGAAILGSASASAGLVSETELDGQSINNTTGLAQVIADSAFTRDSGPNVFGDRPTATVAGLGGIDDVDFYRFTMTRSGSAYFDIDGTTDENDTYLALFRADGTLLGENDDSSPVDPGSESSMDAFLGRIRLTAPGDYFIAVSHFGNFPGASFSGPGVFELIRPDGAFGGFGLSGATPGDASFDQSGPQAGLAYTLHITIPAPSAALTFALAPVAMRRRSRR